MSSLVASAWLDKDLKYTLRFVSKSVFGFLATIALVLRTVEWSKYKDKEPKSCQNICIGSTGKNPDIPTFNARDEKDCDNQELALDKRFAGHSILIFLSFKKNNQNLFSILSFFFPFFFEILSLFDLFICYRLQIHLTIHFS